MYLTTIPKCLCTRFLQNIISAVYAQIRPGTYETTCTKLFPLLLYMCSTLGLPPSLHKFLELSYLPPPPHTDPFHSKSTSSFTPLPHCIPRLCKPRSHLFISFPTSRPQTTWTPTPSYIISTAVSVNIKLLINSSWVLSGVVDPDLDTFRSVQLPFEKFQVYICKKFRLELDDWKKPASNSKRSKTSVVLWIRIRL